MQQPMIPQSVTRTYATEQEYHRDASRLTVAGFTVARHGPGRKRGETVVTWERMVPMGKPPRVPPQPVTLNPLPIVLVVVFVGILALAGTSKPSNTATATVTPVPVVSLANADPTVRAAATENAATFAIQTAAARPSATPGTGSFVGAASSLTVTVHNYFDPAPSGTYSAPTRGNRCVAIDMTLANTGNKAESFSGLLASLKTADDRKYSISIGCSTLAPAITGGTLQMGERQRGYLFFEVPIGVALATFEYTDLLGRPIARFRMP